jgi:hypothetical protein
MAELSNATILERPVRVTTLVSTLRTALRARLRQYQTRDQFVALEKVQAHVQALNAQLESDLDRMAALHTVTTQLAYDADLPRMLQQLLDAAIAITQADMGHVQLADGDRLTIVAHRGVSAPFLGAFAGRRDERSASAAAARSGGRIVVEDVATSPL